MNKIKNSNLKNPIILIQSKIKLYKNYSKEKLLIQAELNYL